ncbi:MAG: tRNA (guanosine(37)-N1)-methyltransferase TrmD [Polyangiaceae bacterium]|nr:tRNA (guanosine(37)-N1)-methyltransferase TrmD [Myxococcales bacterium]MCB9590367.1 tRNA (guanosine(37)-N1)-methyltransferase TrmD [Polyangiaceae bacterium]MCB9604978.1 tRNA (guanosine(37)-N1)-methyltransferase TrmD [Polyangiaceae bacterium]
MQLGVVTLFPELFATFAETSFVGRAQNQGALDLQFEWLREHGLGKHRSVDDTPYGGGSGMVLRVDCVISAIEALEARLGGRAHRVLMTPQGSPFRQATAWRFSSLSRLVLICGRYEGFDERVRDHVDEEVSLGDFVLTGGEVPAMAVIEASVRLIPGVLGNADSIREESFAEENAGGLEYPQYTRPEEFRGVRVPEILKGGDHGKIAEWRHSQAAERTRVRRPDLLNEEQE